MNGATEDCLFLDVMVPTSIYSARKGKGGKRVSTIKRTSAYLSQAPVLVWIHGGGYAVGGKSENGNPAGLLARSQENGGKGVVYVSINYRLGILVRVLPFNLTTLVKFCRVGYQGHYSKLMEPLI